MTEINTEAGLTKADEPTVFQRVKWWLNERRYKALIQWRAGCDWLKWIGHKEGGIESHARRELELAGWFKEDGFYCDMMGHAVMRLCREFSDEGHSGMSAGLAVNLFKDVSMYKPLTPLTGEDDEWVALGYGDGTAFQNRRASHVFKDDEGRAYDINGKVFREPDGCSFTSRDSRVFIEFPYTPTTEYVDVKKTGEEP